VSTRLAVVKLMIYYTMYRAELLKDGPQGPLMLRYLKLRINEIVEKNFFPQITQNRLNMTVMYRALYDHTLHEQVEKFFGWMKTQFPNLTRENISKLEINLPTYLFEFELDIKPQDGKGLKGRKRRFDDVFSDESDTEMEMDVQMVNVHRNLHEQIFSGNSRNIFPGRFTLQPGRSASEYPPGYFDCMIDTQEVPPNMTFPSYFDSMVRHSFQQFSGEFKRRHSSVLPYLL
jgi:hypothetical protein